MLGKKFKEHLSYSAEKRKQTDTWTTADNQEVVEIVGKDIGSYEGKIHEGKFTLSPPKKFSGETIQIEDEIWKRR